jgi:DNA-binding beta-propeller fold protein YncE
MGGHARDDSCSNHNAIMRQRILPGVGFVLVAWLSVGWDVTGTTAVAQTPAPPARVPTFDVDPFWPKPLPHNWTLGQAPSVFVDAQDHIWIVTRPRTLTANDVAASLTPPKAECCVAAPPVIEFDQAGNVMQAWGGPGPGYEWPDTEHGIAVDAKDNVWIGGSGAGDRHILKFTNDGKFLLQIGHKVVPPAKKAADSNDVENLAAAANMFVDSTTNEIYVADGYVNRRVIVYDADTGKYKRHWGAYGNKPDDAAPKTRNPNDPPSQQFNIVHSVKMSNDRIVYAVDRYNNRVQLFTPQGKFLREVFISRETTDSRGTASDVAFSPDKEQRFLYVADAANYKVRILDRSTLRVLGSFGTLGYYAGQWKWLHGLATDSKGNLYTSESQGNRVQKFVVRQ